MLIAGGEIDTDRTADMLLTESRGGKIGKITLETPGEYDAERGEVRCPALSLPRPLFCRLT